MYFCIQDGKKLRLVHSIHNEDKKKIRKIYDFIYNNINDIIKY